MMRVKRTIYVTRPGNDEIAKSLKDFEIKQAIKKLQEDLKKRQSPT